MPALAPPVPESGAAKLAALGTRLRAHRKALRVSATDAAEAAGMSRVTWHRVERGEPSVAMASYINAVAALGLEFEIVDPQERSAAPIGASGLPPLPASLRLADYPQLERLAWQLHGVTRVSPKEALSLYERNWRHLDAAAMAPHEQALVRALERELGGGRLLVRA